MSYAEERAIKICEELGGNWKSGRTPRYRVQDTATDGVRIIVFSNLGKDCIGAEGYTRTGREMMIDQAEYWRSSGYSSHQEPVGNNSRSQTFIKCYERGEDEAIPSEIQHDYQNLLTELGPLNSG